MVIKVYKCKRCDHEWAARKPEKPLTCPKCRSAYWDKERVKNTKFKRLADQKLQSRLLVSIGRKYNEKTRRNAEYNDVGVDIDNNSDMED